MKFDFNHIENIIMQRSQFAEYQRKYLYIQKVRDLYVPNDQHIMAKSHQAIKI